LRLFFVVVKEKKKNFPSVTMTIHYRH